MSKAVPYYTPVVIHDGLGHYRFGLVFASRTDLGEADDFAPVTVVTFKPEFEPSGPAGGNPLEAVEVLHDLAYTEDAGKPGYGHQLFDGEELLKYVPRRGVQPQPVLVPPPAPVTDSTGIQPEQPIALIGGIPVAIRSIGHGLEEAVEVPGGARPVLSAENLDAIAAHAEEIENNHGQGNPENPVAIEPQPEENPEQATPEVPAEEGHSSE